MAALGGWQLAAVVVSAITIAAGLALYVLLPQSQRFERRWAGLRTALLGSVAALRDPVVALICVAGFAAMGVMVGVYNAIGFRLQAAPFSLGTGASLIYFAYPVGILAPQVMRRLSARTSRGVAVTSATLLLALSVLVVSLPSLIGVFIGLGAVTFAFLGTHSLLSGWVVDRAKRQGIGTAQASSAYLLTYYLGSTVAGVAATQQWQSRGWSGVEWLSLGLVAAAILFAVLAARADC